MQARARVEDGPDYTGVWVEDRKIASIGVHVSRGVTTHGFAVNVENDLEPFAWVVACGLPDVQMTSLAAETRRRASDSAVLPQARSAYALLRGARRAPAAGRAARRSGIGGASPSSPRALQAVPA